MKVVDLFSGLEGWSTPFRDRGHEVFSIDVDPRFAPTWPADILDVTATDVLDRFGQPDIIVASPPCESFSVASIGTHWGGGRRAYIPATDKAGLGIALVRKAVELIRELDPRFFVVENPRGILRKLDLIPYERRTVWLCHYGDVRGKPTDLWGRLPSSFRWEPVCHNRRRDHGERCCCRDHAAAPRGAKTGTQGLRNSALRAEIPYGLARALCLAAERDLRSIEAMGRTG
jgi:C-5 cytosine-specific DNA methylase